MFESYNDALKWAQYNFLLTAGNLVNEGTKKLTCKVSRGVSLSFLDIDGFDDNDHSISAWVGFAMQDLYNVKVTLSYSSPYYGRGEVSKIYRVGDLLAADLAGNIIGMVGGRYNV